MFVLKSFQKLSTKICYNVSLIYDVNLTIVSSRRLSSISTSHRKTLLLFDVDGTLTKPRQIIKPDLETFLFKDLKPVACLAIFSGSDLVKIREQLKGPDNLNNFEYIFTENGNIAHKNGKLIGTQNILDLMSEEKLQTFINFCLRYLSDLKLPVKRGHFIEFRTGLINICPIGRSCSQTEREKFEVFDKQFKIRENFRADLMKRFPDFGLTFALGGPTSLDAFPTGWDKRTCLKYLDLTKYNETHFFGDQTGESGNDHHLYKDSRVIGHTVESPDDTLLQLRNLFKKY